MRNRGRCRRQSIDEHQKKPVSAEGRSLEAATSCKPPFRVCFGSASLRELDVILVGRMPLGGRALHGKRRDHPSAFSGIWGIGVPIRDELHGHERA